MEKGLILEGLIPACLLGYWRAGDLLPSVSECELLNPSFFNVVLVATCLGGFPFPLLRVWAEPFATTVASCQVWCLTMCPCLG